MLTCSRCGQTLPVEKFVKDSSRRSGYRSDCKPCRAAQTKAWRAKPGKKAYRAEYARDRRKVAGEQERAWRRKRHSEVAESRRAVQRAYRENNRDRVAARERAWKEANREKVLETARLTAARRRAQKLGTTVGPIDLDALWTGACALCGDRLDRTLEFPDVMRRSVDHIIPLSRGGTHTQDNLQWAHLRCNMSKGNRLPRELAR